MSDKPSYCCQRCGEMIGWLGRIMPFHKCRKRMSEGERAGRRAQVLLYMVLFAVWFNVACIVAWIYMEWFL